MMLPVERPSGRCFYSIEPGSGLKAALPKTKKRARSGTNDHDERCPPYPVLRLNSTADSSSMAIAGIR